VLREGKIDAARLLYRRRLESLRSVDEMVAGIVGELAAARTLDRTYIFFTSDNGFHIGQHRVRAGKHLPYEEDIRVPLLVRGPRAVAGSVAPQLVMNLDIAPTIADLANIEPPSYVDGRSLLPLLRGVQPTGWRRAALLEGWEGPYPNYTGLRTHQYKYVEWQTGERELYDLTADPYEMHSQWPTASPVLQRRLSVALEQLRDCVGATCRLVEASLRVAPPQ
jgi:N-acetylglucosamine-6-sulfatase